MNGIITKVDEEQDYQNKFNMLFAVSMTLPLMLQVTTYFKTYNAYNIGAAMFVVTFAHGFYKLYRFNRDMDKKYTPIWLKSTGKLEKNKTTPIV
jgi:hypothetical protein